ncbi:VOC family protein [Tropicibacter sp. Alg240-R139]|uniref:VOC family protein n=1 Tax=Tropicibacter sp. Alg240-R139 TaxID=2305991 RepID=UPI0013E015B7|nr:VOC family protein [Tropicibacter sp. Alg240-R139]
MKFTTAGVILFTHNYDACVDFYGRVLGLDMSHRIDRAGEQLTTFRLGDTYLMVEEGGVGSAHAKTIGQNPTKFRFNVPDVAVSVQELKDRGITPKVCHHGWGTTAEFTDPDGNRCALRSDDGFGI